MERVEHVGTLLPRKIDQTMLHRRSLLKTATAATIALGVGNPSRLASVAVQDASTFVIGSLEEPGSLSALVQLPHHFPADVPQTLLFDSLTQFMPDGTVEPKLATSWEVSDNELTYTFHLNADARFHDDTPVTAADVVFTVETCLNPETNSSEEGFEDVASVTAVDDLTVEFQLATVTPAFLAQGGARGIVPKHLLEGKNIATDEFNRNPVGCGPYRLVSYTPGEAIHFEAVDGHYRVTPNIPRIDFRVVTDPNVVLTQLMSGELHYGLVAPSNLAMLEGTENIRIVEVPSPRFYDIIPNYERPWCRDVNVRTALLRGIDREGIVSSILLGHGSVVDANVAPASWAYTTDGVTQHPHDPEAAAALLDDAGWIARDDGMRVRDGEPLALTVTLPAYDTTLQQALLVAQQNLEEIGVSLQLESVEAGVFGSRFDDGNYDALGFKWNPVYDPDQSPWLKTGNFYGYSNEQVDALCDEAMSTNEQSAREPVYAELQQVVSEDLPRLFLYTENELHALATGVSGLAAHPVNVFWNLPTWTIR